MGAAEVAESKLVQVARHQVLQRGAGAAIGHVLHVDAGGQLSEFGDHVRPAPGEPAA